MTRSPDVNKMMRHPISLGFGRGGRADIHSNVDLH